MFSKITSGIRTMFSKKPVEHVEHVEESAKKSDKYLYVINGLGCEVKECSTESCHLNKKKHYRNIVWSRHIDRKNTFLCCFPERTIQTIATRITGIGNPLADISELSLEKKDGTDVPLLVILIEHLIADKQVFLFGHSFGGLVVNRICQEMHKCCVDTEYHKQFKDKDGNQYIKDAAISLLMGKLNARHQLKNLIAATFGSIYIPERSTHEKINIFNYMLIGDVAIRCNYYELIEEVPHHYELDRNYLCSNGKILYKYDTLNVSKKVVFMNAYSTSKKVPLNDMSITCDINLNNFKQQWVVHNYYSELIDSLLNNLTNDISKLENNCTNIESQDPYVVPGIVTVKEGGKSKHKHKTKNRKNIKNRKTFKKNRK